ncbi:VOC family protein [Nocardia yamanashiensis]|uniref:VOC family protein n=1 Tax=Nocardia yamanashiensis TaxID=209247 RepID=UPI001E4A0963|nr:VOC family protein [Nocardia yamanashiensis]UGT45008.1 VOC family protein [Nocardia yamanashiensis]
MPTRDTAWPQGTPCWVDCSVDDPAAARDFYAQLLGWEILDSPPEAGGYLMAMIDGRPAAGIGPKMGDVAMPSVWTTYLAADDVDALAGVITAEDGAVFMPPFDVMDVGRMCIAADPTGGVFGLWQAKAHTGAGIFNETGALCWNELHTPAYSRAQGFYSAVFGWTFTEIGDGENFVYSTFAPAGTERPAGGMMDTTPMGGDQPPYWLTWFQVDGTDQALAKATGLGATVLMGPDDSPFGRMGILRGPQDEVFGVIDTNVTIES